jgi:hypothetical protein
MLVYSFGFSFVPNITPTASTLPGLKTRHDIFHDDSSRFGAEAYPDQSGYLYPVAHIVTHFLCPFPLPVCFIRKRLF